MIIYQIYPRSFFDSNGDGIGDLPGILKKIPYVAELGVDAIWISPFFSSPMRDFGYDISDYRGVAPQFGTVDDFVRIVTESHRYGLKVFIDQVWGHSSDQHPWFQESRSSRDNPKSDWYIWSDPKSDGYYPNNWLSIFGGPAWTWNSLRQQYYLHHFLSSQPAFNLRNKEAVAALLEDAWFWVERGVDGIRVDAIPHYLVDEKLRSNPPLKRGKESTSFTAAANPRNLQDNKYTECLPDLLPWIEECRAFFVNRGKDVILLGEIMTGGIGYAGKCVKGRKRLQTAYTGELIGSDISSKRIMEILGEVNATFDHPSKMCWSLGNHDVSRLFSRIVSKAKDSEKRWRLLVSWYFTLEGNLCWYQGDELGLSEAEIPYELIQDPFGKAFWPEFKGRDGCRTPMPWNCGDERGGFTSSTNPWLPIPKDHLECAVDSQNGEAKLSYLRSLLHLRRHEVALRDGSLEICKGLPEEVVGYFRVAGKQKALCLFNFSEEKTVDLSFSIKEVIKSSDVTAGDMVSIGPNGFIISRV